MDNVIEVISEKKETKEFRCQTCGKIYDDQIGHFFHSASPVYDGNNGYTMTCRECAYEKYKEYLELFNGNRLKAMEQLCKLFDFYYNKDIFYESVDDKELIERYMRRIQINPHTKKTYSDTMIEDQEESANSLKDILG